MPGKNGLAVETVLTEDIENFFAKVIFYHHDCGSLFLAEVHTPLQKAATLSGSFPNHFIEGAAAITVPETGSVRVMVKLTLNYGSILPVHALLQKLNLCHLRVEARSKRTLQPLFPHVPYTDDRTRR